ncbi:MAG TPA: 4-hydroxy-3-methylbut-2-enyl diphosphate reductase [Desulfohalobiaceae bacterium]|nr:4-hydroxy-3-methylbut-2-enyl diphosphate reductase [Desulfohalobiaceae bacterium]
MPKIIRGEKAGFCMGVDLALQKLERVVKESEGIKIYTLGPIIHNPQVLDFYKQQGVIQADENDCFEPGSYVVIRAHGIPRDIQDSLEKTQVTIIDATCPKVKKAQRFIEKQTAHGKTLLLFGERHHPEVKGLLSYANSQAKVFENLAELKSFSLSSEYEYFLAAQTTQNRNEFNAIVRYLNTLDMSVPVFDTICDTTRERQQEAIEMSKHVEVMVVVGGYRSGNTRRLAQVISSHEVESIHVEQASELPLSHLLNKEIIGLTAGASTPKSVIDDVERVLANG